MKIIMLTKYSRKGASSRLRSMQYIPFLERAGIKVEVMSLFDDVYLSDLYQSNKRRLSSVKYYVQRIKDLRMISDAELIWIEKEAFPWMPYLVENMIIPSGVKVVTDHDDAIFHKYDRNKSTVIRNLLGDKIDAMMRRSDLVVAGNEYIASRANSAGARKVAIVPTVVDYDRYSIDTSRHNNEKLSVGWIGTPGTWRQYIDPMLEDIMIAIRENSATLTVVGSGQPSSENINSFDWAEETEVDLIKKMDIGLMPLDNSPWSMGKCGYKLIQYMACGIPVIASPVGVNSTIVDHGVNGFLASSNKEWAEAIGLLASDTELRKTMGNAGRRKVESDYSLKTWGPKVVDLIRSV